MMNQRLHGALHLAALGRHELVVHDRYRTLSLAGGELFQALLHDPYRLTHLLHPDAVAIVAVAILAYWDIEIEIRVRLVRLRLAQVPGRAGSAHHHTGKAPG